MLRKMVIALATTAALALAAVPSGASARVVGHGVGVGVGHVGGWGHPGFARLGFHRFHRFGFRRGPYVVGAYPWHGSCWHLVPGPFGWHRAWVCGPYRYLG
ncbi:MAG TPA: hypothetical protein VK456_03580 [Xanthobacteraceae bacterium]|nr:hypothetical protein [Xanthobacteraceae bacterium]